MNLTALGGEHHQSASVSPSSREIFSMVEFAWVSYYFPMYYFRGGLSAHTPSSSGVAWSGESEMLQGNRALR